jgi:hypothetical protein
MLDKGGSRRGRTRSLPWHVDLHDGQEWYIKATGRLFLGKPWAVTTPSSLSLVFYFRPSPACP